MTQIDKISSQVAKVRAKIAELRAIQEEKDDACNNLTQAYANMWEQQIAETRDQYLELTAKANRTEGIIKRMSRKTIELYYGGECAWFQYEYAFQYINKFNETFKNWA